MGIIAADSRRPRRRLCAPSEQTGGSDSSPDQIKRAAQAEVTDRSDHVSDIQCFYQLHEQKSVACREKAERQGRAERRREREPTAERSSDGRVGIHLRPAQTGCGRCCDWFQDCRTAEAAGTQEPAAVVQSRLPTSRPSLLRFCNETFMVPALRLAPPPEKETCGRCGPHHTGGGVTDG